MSRRTIGILLVLLPSVAWLVMGAEPGSAAPYAAFRDPDFLLSVGANLLGIGLFLSRVHAPQAAEWFGYGTQLLGIPALALVLSDLGSGKADLSTWANAGYAVWAIGAALVDHVLDIEYREPVRPEILIPYVASYYVAIGFQAAVLLDKGIMPWAVAGSACIANVVASFYARAHESAQP